MGRLTARAAVIAAEAAAGCALRRADRPAISRPPRTKSLLSPLGSGDDHIDRSAPAARAHEPIAPIENAGPGAISPGHVGGVGLDLVVARLTPHDESDVCRSRVAERHQWAGLRFHELRALIPETDIWRATQPISKRHGRVARRKRRSTSRASACRRRCRGSNLAPGSCRS
jgi:hypothetical protein